MQKNENGTVSVSSKSSCTYIKNFMNDLVEDPLSIKNDWINFGGEVEDEIIPLDNLRTALIMCGINLKDMSPEDWLKRASQ